MIEHNISQSVKFRILFFTFGNSVELLKINMVRTKLSDYFLLNNFTYPCF